MTAYAFMDENELETKSSFANNEAGSAITNHPLTKFVMEQSPLIVISHIDAGEFINDESAAHETLDEYIRNPKHFDGKELCQFLVAESRLFYSLGIRLDKLQHTIPMINFFPYAVNENTLTFTKAEYIEDIMELYIINSLGVFDRILEIINLLYDLKIPKKKLNKKALIEKDIKNLRLLKEIRLLDHVLSEIRKSRNLVVHESFYYNEELENIFQQELRFRERLDSGNQKSVEERSKYLDHKYDVFIRDETTDLYINDSVLTKTLKNIYDELYKQHKKRLKAYGYKIEDDKLNNSKSKPVNSLRMGASIYNLNFDDLMLAVEEANRRHAGKSNGA